MFFDLERSFDPNREAMIYRYATGNETNKMVIVYSFQTEECSHIVYEEYYPDTSEELPQYVDILGTNDSDYFYIFVNQPTEQLTKEWISQWGILHFL